VRRSQPRSDLAAPLEDEAEAHLLVIAPTGAGKGRGVIIPNLLHYDGPAIVLDVKGEAAAVTARYRREIGQDVVILDPFRVLGCANGTLNPLDLLKADSPSIADDAFMLAEMIASGSRGSREPFWDDHAVNLLAGLMVFAATSQDVRERNLAKVWKVLAADDAPLFIAGELDAKSAAMHPFAYEQFTTFLNHEGDKVRTSVLSTAQQHMRIFASAQVQAATAATSFALDAVSSGAPLTIYFVIPPTKLASHASLLRLWVSTLLAVISERPQRPEKPTLLVIDELAQLGPLPLIKQAVTLLRGYGVRCALFLQSLSQLRGLWPQDHESITENCGTILTFGHTSLTMSRQIADLFGDVTAEALFALPTDQLALHRAGKTTEVVRRLDYLADPLFRGTFDPNPRFRREARAVGQ
jgi:type IV secretion system protein VirD4